MSGSFVKTKQGQPNYYPAIPQPYPNQPGSIIEAVTAMKRVVEALNGSSGPKAASAVTFQTVGAAIVSAVQTGQLSPTILTLVNPTIVNPGIPPSVINTPGLGLSQAQVLARISVEVVR